MSARGTIIGLALGCLLVACGDDGGTAAGDSSGGVDSSTSTGAAMITGPAVTAALDVAAACGSAGATRVELHATRVACVDPLPAPCTVPNPPRPTIGDGVDCPAASSPATLHVELTAAGRYFVEAVTFAGDDELARVCHGVGGEPELLVTDEQLAAAAVVEVLRLDGSACS